MTGTPKDPVDLLAWLVNSLIESASPPPIPEELKAVPRIDELHQKLVGLRGILSDFTKGNLSGDIRMKGFMPGSLKALQSHLRHMTWQVQQVERGDFTQRLQFLGEFSEAFNNMVIQLDTTMKALRLKEEALTTLAKTLQKEVELRTAAVYALKQSEAKFKYLAEHDALTGVLNRRSFHSLATAEMQSASLAGVPCCIAMLDIDHFKKFNDTYGHPEGDEALKHMVGTAQKHLRQCDIFGRYGGEEFIFFFSGADLQQGYAAAERIRAAIQENPVPISDGRMVPITVSVGVGVILPEWYHTKHTGELMQHITTNADNALYEAKKLSRNRVLTAAVTPPPYFTGEASALASLAPHAPSRNSL